MREKVGKSRSTVFFQWFVAPEGRKVGSLKRRVRSQLARRLPKANALLRQVQESKGNEFWEAVLQMLDVKNVCDLSPGSGTLASTCLRMQIPYLGILRSDAHHSYWGNVLDRQCLQYLSDSNSILYNESLSELIQELFCWDAHRAQWARRWWCFRPFWWVRQQAHSPMILRFLHSRLSFSLFCSLRDMDGMPV